MWASLMTLHSALRASCATNSLLPRSSVLLAIEEDDHGPAQVVLLDQTGAFEADRDGAGIVVGSRRAGDGIVMRAEQNVGLLGLCTGREHYVVELALEGRSVAQAPRMLEQQVPGSAIGALVSRVVARKCQPLDNGAQVFG